MCEAAVFCPLPSQNLAIALNHLWRAARYSVHFMLSNYYILHHVVRELRHRIVGREFVGAYSVHAGELAMMFDEDTVVTSILNPAHATLYASTVANAGAPRRNSIAFFGELSGRVVTDVSIAHDDKVITLSFDEFRLVLRFYNSPNALLYRGSEVISAFKKEPETSHHATPGEISLIRAALPMLGKFLEREFFVRFPECIDASADLIGTRASEFDALLRASDLVTLYKRSGDLLLAPIELYSLAVGEKPWTIDRQEKSVSQAISDVLRVRRKLQALSDRKRSIRSRLEAIAARTRKAAEDARHGLETGTRADRHRAIADAISLVAHGLDRGATEITYEYDGEQFTAPLDPKLSAYENAAKFYDKARKSDQAKAELSRRLVDLERNGAVIASLLEDLNAIAELRTIDEFEKSLRARTFLLERSDESAERSGDDLDRFRRYRVAGGFEVLAGKNAKQNDELTMKIATKEDLWFHARHVAGSHVVLRSAGKKDIPYAAIEQAASIAAFFSEAKTQKVAPVAYTKRKFVRKPKGAAPGAVVVEREEVVMVEPKEPV